MSTTKRIRFLPVTALFVMFSVFLLPSQAHAFSLFESFDKSTEVETAKAEFDAKYKEVDKQEKETDKFVEQKDSLKKSVSNLKKEVKSLDNLFVKIDKYAPNAAGNSYALGNCTWYVKSMRPDIGNFWGNANAWYYQAQAQGWNVGDKPKKGAVATTTEGWAGHVAYVVGVSLDQSTAVIREMNYNGLYSMNERTVSANEFKYIYELN